MIPWTATRQAPLSVEFSRQEYWSGLSFPPPGDLPDPRIEPASPLSPAFAGGFFTIAPLGKRVFVTGKNTSDSLLDPFLLLSPLCPVAMSC